MLASTIAGMTTFHCCYTFWADWSTAIGGFGLP
jgi:hypothetical protein